MKPIVYQQAARKTLMRTPPQDARRIIGKIEQYAANPQSLSNNVKALQGRNGIRLRVGDWRVIMEDGVVLDVLAIGNRSEIYK
jgi:mRNA interferase RelE/StbE